MAQAGKNKLIALTTKYSVLGTIMSRANISIIANSTCLFMIGISGSLKPNALPCALE